MSKTDRSYSVFIASPGDCREERRVARAAVGRIDRLIGQHLGHRLEAIGWKTDAFPEAGRPQDVINGLLDKADIVLVIFWHRFGTDAGKGMTGTEEEFHRSLARHDETAEPRILVYFKQVDQKNPPLGLVKSQVSRLRKFRRGLEKGRSVLYEVFEQVEDWVPRLEEALAKELFRRWNGAPGKRTVVPGPPYNELSTRIVDLIQALRFQMEDLEITGGEPLTKARVQAKIDELVRRHRRLFGLDPKI